MFSGCPLNTGLQRLAESAHLSSPQTSHNRVRLLLPFHSLTRVPRAFPHLSPGLAPGLRPKPKPSATDLCPGPGRSGSPTAALGMLIGSGGGRLVSLARTRGSGLARGCSWSPGAGSWSCQEFPRPLPPRAPLAGARAGAASSEQRAASS